MKLDSLRIMDGAITMTGNIVSDCGFYVGSDDARSRRISFAVCLLAYMAGNRTVHGSRCFSTVFVSVPRRRSIIPATLAALPIAFVRCCTLAGEER